MKKQNRLQRFVKYLPYFQVIITMKYYFQVSSAGAWELTRLGCFGQTSYNSGLEEKEGYGPIPP